ncbi:MAG TPA: efflux RND transporter periplasmic adaptor subunit, partial [Candidatus Omnitrophota bacterium]|nr:efflux RND transporter periplasmic adaptor subunit [Candidatus Omnitrophota bacterium]
LREYRTSLGTLRSRELAFKNLVDSRWEAPRVEVAKSKLVLMGMDDDSIRQLVESSKADDALLYLEPKGPVWVYADVFESEVSWIRKGDRVKLGLSSVYGKSYEGRVHSIGSMVDPATRRIRVSILLQNDGTLKSEMLLDAVIESSAGKGLAVPEEAVFFTGTAAIVFVDKGKGLFEPRDVLVGIKAGDHFEIKSGLVEGESVVVNGNFLLDSESRLKASLKQQAEIHVGHGGSHD